MHIFFIDSYIGLDTLSPITYFLKKNNQKTIIYNLNPVEDLKKDNLTKFLINNNVIYKCIFPKDVKNFISIFLLKIILFLPKIIAGKLWNLWNYVFKKAVFIKKKDLKLFISKLNTKSITIDEGLTENKKQMIATICTELKIPIILVPNGLDHIKGDIKSYENFERFNFYLCSNNLRTYDDRLKLSSKLKYIGAARYSEEWINILNKIYPQSRYLDESEKKLCKIGFFVKYSIDHWAKYSRFDETRALITKIRKMKNVIVKVRNKPRDTMPLKYSKASSDNLNSTELIGWSDIIISPRSSSVLIEAVKKNRIVILLEYINPQIKELMVYDYDSIIKIKSEAELIDLIENYLKNNIKIDKSKNQIFLKDFLYRKNIKNNVSTEYINFYESFEK